MAQSVRVAWPGEAALCSDGILYMMPHALPLFPSPACSVARPGPASLPFPATVTAPLAGGVAGSPGSFRCCCVVSSAPRRGPTPYPKPRAGRREALGRTAAVPLPVTRSLGRRPAPHLFPAVVSVPYRWISPSLKNLPSDPVLVPAVATPAGRPPQQGESRRGHGRGARGARLAAQTTRWPVEGVVDMHLLGALLGARCRGSLCHILCHVTLRQVSLLLAISPFFQLGRPRLRDTRPGGPEQRARWAWWSPRARSFPCGVSSPSPTPWTVVAGHPWVHPRTLLR